MALGVADQNLMDDLAGAGDRVLRLWLFSVAALVVAMVAVGGATRLTDSGLSITEWKPLLGAIPPLSAADWTDAFEKYKQIPEYKLVNEGMSLAEFKFIYWWEWGHRFLGRFIGLAFGLPLLAFWLAGRIPAAAKVPLLGLLLLGGLQGFVGWYMVQSGLVERVDVSHYRLAMHLTLAFLILAALVWMGLSLGPRDPLEDLQPVSTGVRVMALLLVLLLVLQVVLGAFVAGTKAGLIFNTWPTMNGDWLPDDLLALTPWYLNALENHTAIQFNHRMLAYVIAAMVLIYVLSLMRGCENARARTSAWLLAAAVLGQAGLGVWTLLAADGLGKIPIGLGVVHQTFAAVLFAIAIWHLHIVLHARKAE